MKTKKNEVKTCFICGDQQELLELCPSSKEPPTFFKNILSQWRNKDNSETCTNCLPFIDKVWRLHQQILSCQKEIKDMVIKAYAKGEEKKVQRELSTQIKINTEIEVESQDMSEEEDESNSEVIEPEGGESNRKIKNKRIIKSENVQSSDNYTSDEEEMDNIESSSPASSLEDPLELSPKKEVNKLACNICLKIFPKKFSLERHMNIHKKGSHQCNICKTSFNTSFYLQNHRYRVHNIESRTVRTLQCPLCERKFSLKEKLEDHLDLCKNKKKKITCDYCSDEEFNSYKELNSHLEDSHPKLFKCYHCEKTFVRKYSFERHIKTHNEEGNYNCDVCNKKFKSSEGQIQHLKTIHETQKKHFSCDKCTKMFTVKQSLKIHQKFHSLAKERPFACEECEVRFRSKEKLDTHLESHKKEDYQCSYCDKTFQARYNLVRHEFSHTHGRRKPKNGKKRKIIHKRTQKEEVLVKEEDDNEESDEMDEESSD